MAEGEVLEEVIGTLKLMVKEINLQIILPTVIPFREKSQAEITIMLQN